MTADEMERLRQEWRARLERLTEQLTGPLDQALERAQVGLSRAERIHDKAYEIERAHAMVRLNAESGPAPKRRDPLWAFRKRMRGR